MKIKLLLGTLLLFTVSAQAQVSYGIKGGLNFPKLYVSATESGVTASTTTKTSTNFYVSGYANVPAATNFAIQPGISLQGKGGKQDGASLNFMSIEIPLNAVYSIPTGTIGSVFFGAGPYVGFNVAGQTKSDNVKVDIEFGSGQDEINIVDYGVNFHLGYTLPNGFLVNGCYGLGLAHVGNYDVAKVTNRVFSFGVGFEF